jgi:hypothetical protein
MWSRSLFSICMVLLLSSQPVAAADVLMPVNKDFGEGDLTINGYGKGYIYRWDVLLIDGYVHLCGVGTFPDGSTAHAMKGQLRKAKLTYRGKTILKDVSFFGRERKGTDLSKAKAVCRTTGVVPVKNGGDFVLDWAGGNIRF